MWLVIDVETTGPCPGLYSMYELGAVAVYKGEIVDEFEVHIQPDTSSYEPQALAVTGVVWEDLFEEPYLLPTIAMHRFDRWLAVMQETYKSRLMFISDNNGFDFSFVNYYLHKYVGRNRFGWSSTNLGSLYKGFVKKTYIGTSSIFG